MQHLCGKHQQKVVHFDGLKEDIASILSKRNPQGQSTESVKFNISLPLVTGSNLELNNEDKNTQWSLHAALPPVSYPKMFIISPFDLMILCHINWMGHLFGKWVL